MALVNFEDEQGRISPALLFAPPKYVRDAPFSEKYWWQACTELMKEGRAYLPPTPESGGYPLPNYHMVARRWKRIISDRLGVELPKATADESFTSQLNSLQRTAGLILKTARVEGASEAARVAGRLLGMKRGKKLSKMHPAARRFDRFMRDQYPERFVGGEEEIEESAMTDRAMRMDFELQEGYGDPEPYQPSKVMAGHFEVDLEHPAFLDLADYDPHYAKALGRSFASFVSELEEDADLTEAAMEFLSLHEEGKKKSLKRRVAGAAGKVAAKAAMAGAMALATTAATTAGTMTGKAIGKRVGKRASKRIERGAKKKRKSKKSSRSGGSGNSSSRSRRKSSGSSSSSRRKSSSSSSRKRRSTRRESTEMSNQNLIEENRRLVAENQNLKAHLKTVTIALAISEGLDSVDESLHAPIVESLRKPHEFNTVAEFKTHFDEVVEDQKRRGARHILPEDTAGILDGEGVFITNMLLRGRTIHG